MGEAWYAIYTRSRHEKQVEAYLQQHRLLTYLPLRRAWSRRQDRRVALWLPALPGYLFVRCVLLPDTRALIKRHSGVLRLVENAGQPVEIPDREVESLRRALEHAASVQGHPFLKVGDRVRVLRGPMVGVEGYLVRIADKEHRLVIGVAGVNQALSVAIDARDVEAA